MRARFHDPARGTRIFAERIKRNSRDEIPCVHEIVAKIHGQKWYDGRQSPTAFSLTMFE